MIQPMLIDTRVGTGHLALPIVSFSLVGAFLIFLLASIFAVKKTRPKLKTVLCSIASVGLIVALALGFYSLTLSYPRADRPGRYTNPILTMDILLLICGYLFSVLAACAFIIFLAKRKNTTLTTLIVQAIAMFLMHLTPTIIYTIVGNISRSNWGILFGFVILNIATLIGLILVILKRFFPATFRTKDLAWGGVLLAVGIVLSYISVRMFAEGGRITLASSIPIMLFCYFFGLRKGSVIVFAFLAFQFIQGPFILHAWSALLDYVIPYLALIFFGVFSYRRNLNRKKVKAEKSSSRVALSSHANFFIALVLYTLVRYFSHVLSGGLFFGEFARDGFSVWGWAFFYNTFFLIDVAIALVAAIILLAIRPFNKAFINASRPTIIALPDGTLAAAATPDNNLSSTQGGNASVGISGDTLQDADAAKEDDEGAASTTDEG